MTNSILIYHTCRPSESQSSSASQTRPVPPSNDAATTTGRTSASSTPAVQLSDLQSILSNMESEYGNPNIILSCKIIVVLKCYIKELMQN